MAKHPFHKKGISAIDLSGKKERKKEHKETIPTAEKVRYAYSRDMLRGIKEKIGGAKGWAWQRAARLAGPKTKKLIVFVKKTFPKKQQAEANEELRAFLTLSIPFLLMILGSFFVFSFVQVQQKVLAQKTEIEEDLSLVKSVAFENYDFFRISEYFSRMRGNVLSLREFLPDVEHNTALSYSYLSSFRELTEAGIHILAAGEVFGDVISNVKRLLTDAKLLPVDALRERYRSLTSFLKFQWKAIEEQGIPELQEARAKLAHVDTSQLPVAVQEQIELLKMYLDKIDDTIDEVNYLLPKVLSFFGDDYPRRYVVLLQNSTEARATGGFIGSLAFVSFNDGWLEDITFKDVYEYDGQFFEDIPPPPGLERITHSFRMRDANYWPDFPTSAKQVAWFLDKEKGPGVDGVLAITDRMIIDFIELLGPIDVDGVRAQFTHENFSTLMSYIVESKQNRASPKEILFSFATHFLAKLQHALMQDTTVLNELIHQMESRQILAYSFIPEIQEVFQYFGVDGSMYQDAIQSSQKRDYFMLTHTSIGANKSDKYVQERLDHKTVIDPAGRIMDKVRITRTHTWDSQVERTVYRTLASIGVFDLSDTLAFILGKGANKDYVRFYVPSGAKIVDIEGVSADDVQTYNDLGKTVIAFPLLTPVGGESSVMVTYLLPEDFHLKKNEQILPYHVLFEKQPGGRDIQMHKYFEVDKSFLVIADKEHNIQDTSDTELRIIEIGEEEFPLTYRSQLGYLFYKEE